MPEAGGESLGLLPAGRPPCWRADLRAVLHRDGHIVCGESGDLERFANARLGALRIVRVAPDRIMRSPVYPDLDLDPQSGAYRRRPRVVIGFVPPIGRLCIALCRVLAAGRDASLIVVGADDEPAVWIASVRDLAREAKIPGSRRLRRGGKDPQLSACATTRKRRAGAATSGFARATSARGPPRAKKGCGASSAK